MQARSRPPPLANAFHHLSEPATSAVVVACEPLAADVRKSKDGKTNAKLKIIAAMFGVTFDEVRRREDQRRFQRRVRMTLALGFSTVALAAAYLIALDAGIGAPGGAAFIKIDSHELSVMRPIPEEAAIRDEAAALRQRLVAWLEEARGGSNSFPAVSTNRGSSRGLTTWLRSHS